MVFSVDLSDRILIIAAHPEDLAVGCGGFISKYPAQVDLLCVNKVAIQDLVQVRHDEFCAVSMAAKVNKFYIENFSAQSEKHLQNCMKQFNMRDYDIILIPNKDDNDNERKFVANDILKNLLENQGCKNNLKILRYEVWNPLKEANYYEDITNVLDKKTKLILSYKGSSGAVFAERVLSMNKFRTFTSYLSCTATHVEAYFIDDLNAYMEKPDIVDENTDKDYKNEELETYLREQNAQIKINTLAERFAGKKAAIFCAGEFSRCVFKNYDLSKLNIVAIADRRFEENRQHKFYGIKCIKPKDLNDAEIDVILIAAYDFVKFYDILTNTIIKNCDIEIAPLIKNDLSGFSKGDLTNKICVRPFHVTSIVPTGHCITCCPAYIKNFAIGNILQEDFDKIWQGRRAKYLRNALINDDYTTCDLKTCIHLELADKSKLPEYFDENTGEIKLPDTIFMSWDYDCNVACITCRNEIIKNDEATLKNLKVIEQRVLDACKNAKYFYTSGNGDPFGSSYARGLIKKIVEINPSIKFLIHTNGVLCTPKICDELNITDKMESVSFSIHAACKETYDKIVRYGNFDKVVQNLEWISSLKSNGAVRHLTMIFVVHKLNYKDMPDFVRMAEKYNAIASFRYYRQWSHNTEYSYEDMAVFEETHPEHAQFVEMLQDKVFDSPNCYLDPSLQFIRNNGVNP